MKEPAWPGRTVEEACEIARHEALINRAFTGMAAAILCPYDSRQLAPSVINEAGGTHPHLLAEGQCSRTVPTVARWPAVVPLPVASAAGHHADVRVETYEYYSGLHRLRQWVVRQARPAGLSPGRVTDLVIAAGELAAKTLRHTAAGGTALVYR